MKFDLQEVLDEKINETHLRAYCVKFDFGVCKIEALADILLDGLVDFAFGYHKGILETYNRRLLKEAAGSLYSIEKYKATKTLYIDNDSMWDMDETGKTADQINYERQVLGKGEFGELLLHVYLRDYFETVPLLSKIYFKDTDGVTVHGFDAIHIGKDLADTSKYSLFLGESKLYAQRNGNGGKNGVKDLAADIKVHFKGDFLSREFALVAKKQSCFEHIEDYSDKNTYEEYKDFLSLKDDWIDRMRKVSEGKGRLQELLQSVTIPVICTYESNLFQKNPDVEGFEDDYFAEMRLLEDKFTKAVKSIPFVKGEPQRSDLNIILILMPIPSKKEFVKLLHQKTLRQQNA